MLKTCFVIQRFDNDVYDKRYRETFAPAIEKGGAKPIRADEVLGTRPVVQKIEEGLRSADVAFAEVSEDNPNVFVELGYALALNIPTVIVCDKKKRDRLPFDIAHRPVNFYTTDAQSDYERVAREIQQGISAALLEAKHSHSAQEIEDKKLDSDEVKGACLLAFLDDSMRSSFGSTMWSIQKEVASSGITEKMATLAILSLISDGLVDRTDYESGDEGPYSTYRLSDAGTKHILRSYSALMQQETLRANSEMQKSIRSIAFDQDVPF